jgi:hypothetical protein
MLKDPRLRKIVRDVFSLELPKGYEIRLSYFFIENNTRVWKIWRDCYSLDETNSYIDKGKVCVSQEWITFKLTEICKTLDSQHQTLIFPDSHFWQFVY